LPACFANGASLLTANRRRQTLEQYRRAHESGNLADRTIIWRKMSARVSADTRK